jgi:hypothetical protein
MLKSSSLWEIHIKIFSSETTGPIATKLWWNDPSMGQEGFYGNFP